MEESTMYLKQAAWWPRIVALTIFLCLCAGLYPNVTLAQAPTCPPCGEEVVVDENVTVDFNVDPPTCSGDADLCAFFTADKSGGTTADTWKAIFDLGSRSLLVKNGATITVKTVPGYSNNQKVPGIEIRACELEVEAGGSIELHPINQPGGDIYLHVGGDVTIDGTVLNFDHGTGGMPGDIMIVSCCGNIYISPTGLVKIIGQDPGGSDIYLITCCSDNEGDIVIEGLVDAQYKSGRPSTINIAAFKGSIAIDGNNSFGTEAGTRRPITSGVTVRSVHAPVPGTINILAKEDIKVLGNTILEWRYENYGAVAIKTASNSSKGGDMNVVSLEGKIVASDRAFDNANRFNTTATIDLLSQGNIELTATGRSNSVHYLPPHPAGVDPLAMAVVSTKGGDTGQGGTNTLRSFSGDVLIGNGTVPDDGIAQVLANWGGRPGSNGANLLTSCSPVTIQPDGEVLPAPTINNNVCSPLSPDPLFAGCEALEIECECEPELFDFGDAPAGYPVTLAQNGAYHALSDLFLGPTVDGETNGAPQEHATGDDDASDDDENGVVFLTPLVLGQNAMVRVTATYPLGYPQPYLSAWIDFNHDLDWNDPGEQIIVNAPMSTQDFVYTVPGDAALGFTYARFRLSTQQNLTPLGGAPDGEVEDYEVEITEQTECFWCNKGTVLTQVDQNMGDYCFIPDIFVDFSIPHPLVPVDPDKIGTGEPATNSLQASIDYVNSADWPAHDPTPGDGQIFIGVNSTDCEDTPDFLCASTSRVLAGDTPFGVENVVITNTRPERLNVFGCSVSLHAADADEPVITIENGVGKVTVMDIHVSGSHVAGYLVQNNAELVVVKNSRSIGASGIGYWIVDDLVEITGAQEVSNHDIGILVDGSNVTLRTNNEIVNNGIGIKIVGDGNESNNNDVGLSGKPNNLGILVEGKDNLLQGDAVNYNTTDGIVVTGSGTSLADGNTIKDEDAQHNGDDGIVVSGNYNTLDGNRQVKFNGGDGIEISGNHNLLDGNVAAENVGHGINLSGNNNTLDENDADENGGDGIHVTGDNNDLTKNAAEDNTLNGIKADEADGATNNDFDDNDARNNALQGIRACGQNDLGGNSGSGNTVNPQVDFVCTPPGPPKFFVSDGSDDEVYQYDASWTLVGNFDTGSNGSGDPFGLDVVGSGTDVYVLDENDMKVYKYDAAGTYQSTSRLLRETDGTALNSPRGLAIDGDEMWIVDQSMKIVYRYSLSAAFAVGGNLSAAQQFALDSNNGNAEGLALDATYLYVLDSNDRLFYRYSRAGGAATLSKALRQTVAAGGGNVSSPRGASLEGTYMWIVDPSLDDALSYDLASLFSGTGNLNASSQFDLDALNGDAQGLGLIAGGAKASANDPGAERTLPIPHETSLLGSYPNPFNPTTTIQFQLSESDRVTMKVYDILGREVRALLDGEVKQSGYHAIAWDGRNSSGETVPSGVYFIRLLTSRTSEVHKTMLLK